MGDNKEYKHEKEMAESLADENIIVTDGYPVKIYTDEELKELQRKGVIGEVTYL